MNTRTIAERVISAIEENGTLSLEELLRVLADEDGLNVISALFALYNADLARVETDGKWGLIRGCDG